MSACVPGKGFEVDSRFIIGSCYARHLALAAHVRVVFFFVSLMLRLQDLLHVCPRGTWRQLQSRAKAVYLRSFLGCLP